MALLEQIKVLAFDADDTLWANEPRFRAAERQVAQVISDYCDFPTMSAALYRIEVENMDDYGYGAKAFVLSMLQTALKLTGGALTGSQVGQILAIGRELLQNPAHPLEGVEETLKVLHALPGVRMVMLTKGDLLDQEHKIARSGLAPYFDAIRIVSDKGQEEYRQLCREMGIRPEELMMTGNSFKSDIAPVLHLGGYGIHIPFEMLWALEETEEFDHEHLYRIERFPQILDVLGISDPSGSGSTVR